jgi:hypothetical protein
MLSDAWYVTYLYKIIVYLSKRGSLTQSQYYVLYLLYVYNSASITHQGIKCPSYGCDRYLTMHDITGLTAYSYGPHKLTIADFKKIHMCVQDAELIHGIPIDEIVYCSVSYSYVYIKLKRTYYMRSVATVLWKF